MCIRDRYAGTWTIRNGWTGSPQAITSAITRRCTIKDPFTFARTNVMGTLSLLQAARLCWESLPEKYEGKRFYHISTDEVYGDLEITHPEGIKSPFADMAAPSGHNLAYGTDFFLESTPVSYTHLGQVSGYKSSPC